VASWCITTGIRLATLVDRILRLVPAQSDAAKRNEVKSNHEGSRSFLKKRTKKLLLSSVRGRHAHRVNQQSKSFLVLFFKKELLPLWPLPGVAGLFV
jgi:hypothetical protein